jgi:uncharacterized protein (DUF1800 family)
MKAMRGNEGPEVWEPYSPSPDIPWDLRRVVHLHRRAGFAATWGEIRRDLKDGPQASVDRVLAGTSRIGTQADFEERSCRLADAAESQMAPARLKAWWAFRMLEGPDPLGERLTLMWHNHFATSNLKVDDVAAMRRQNDTLRHHARGPFGGLLRALVHDAALLAWLDASENQRGLPNENLARELMELFSLGIGHFTERDVKEAARALTGLAVRGGESRLDLFEHDDGQKIVLGHAGRLGAAELLDILLDHHATADRLAWRICDALMGEGTVGPGMLSALAAGLRASRLDVGRAVETVLRSAHFFDRKNLGAMVLDPAGMVVGPPRALGLTDRGVDPQALAAWMAAMGQDLFYPPNVGGWAGGRAWLSTRAVIARTNYASWVASGSAWANPAPPEFEDLAGLRRDDPLTSASELLTGVPAHPESRSRFMRQVHGVPPGEASRRAVAFVLSSSQFQEA